jgi:hypothetical protein
VSLISDEDRALVKEVVKKGRVTLKQRAVPPQVGSGLNPYIAAALLLPQTPLACRSAPASFFCL